MQIVNCVVALAGDPRNTVPKYAIPVSELALLRLIHGEEAVTEIEVLREERRPHGPELERLREIYAARDENGVFMVNRLYPGAAPRLYEHLDDLGLPDNLFSHAQRNRMAAEAPDPLPEPEEAAEAAPAPRRGGRPRKAAPAPAPADDLDEIDADPEPTDLLD